MEGGSKLVEYLTYGMMGFVLLALGILAVRSAWFFLSLLAIPLAESLGRLPPFRGAVERWGERGARRDPALWAARLDGATPASSPASQPRLPRPVRVGARVGAVVGALPGAWSVVGAFTPGNGGWTAGAGVVLVLAAGMLVGLALGAGVGLLVATLRPPQER